MTTVEACIDARQLSIWDRSCNTGTRGWAVADAPSALRVTIGAFLAIRLLMSSTLPQLPDQAQAADQSPDEAPIADHLPDETPPETLDSLPVPAEQPDQFLTPGAGPDETPAPAPAPVDCAQMLKQAFPALFTGSAKPLKLRIQVDIQARSPGVFSKQALSAFFRRYTGSTSYLLAVSKATNRFDLDGAPSGEISDDHRKVALEELARRRGNQESRRALEEQQRRNRATLLHDFERTTLTPVNFCALKEIGVDELDGYLATARQEAAERPPAPPAFDDGRRSPSPRPGPRRR